MMRWRAAAVVFWPLLGAAACSPESAPEASAAEQDGGAAVGGAEANEPESSEQAGAAGMPRSGLNPDPKGGETAEPEPEVQVGAGGSSEPASGGEPDAEPSIPRAGAAAPSFDPNDPANIPPGTGPLGQETTCDGKDDDSNGVVDDVDLNSDGVCDCLAVATLGLHGEWGDGDVVGGFLRDHLDAAIEDLGDAELTETLLAPFDILLIRDVSSMNNPGLSFSEDEATALWNWVRSGGGLMTVIGYSDPAEVNNVNRLLDVFGLAYGVEPIVQGQNAAVPVSTWVEHPLSVGVNSVGADNGYPVEGQGTAIASEDGFDMGMAVTIGDGHVFVWGDEWVTYEDEWQGDVNFQVGQLWVNVLRWLPRVNRCQVPAAP